MTYNKYEADGEALERFVNELRAFNDVFGISVKKLRNEFDDLGYFFDDSGYRRFASEFNECMNSMEKFLNTFREFETPLHKAAKLLCEAEKIG